MFHARLTCMQCILKQVRAELSRANATWVREEEKIERVFNVLLLLLLVCVFFLSSFIYSFDLISCTVYKLNLMSFSIAAVAAAAAAAWRRVREQCYAHEIEKWIWRPRSSSSAPYWHSAIVYNMHFFLLWFAVVFLNTNSDPYAQTKNFNAYVRVLHLFKCVVWCGLKCMWTFCCCFFFICVYPNWNLLIEYAV